MCAWPWGKGPMHHRRRILLLFGIGIVLPSLLLGYFAFRGIQNDRALVEKERLESTRRAADQVIRTVEDGINAAESMLSKEIVGYAGSLSPERRQVINKLAAKNPLVEQLFYFEGSKNIQFLIDDLLYVPDGRREVGTSRALEPSLPAELEAAQRLEFQDKDYPRALAAYRQAGGRSSKPSLSGLILNAIARVQRKSGFLREAVQSYGQILKDYSGIVIPGGIPLGPSAALEVCALSRELGDNANALKASVGLYRSLLRRVWDLERAEFAFFVGRAKSLIESYLADPPAGLDVQGLRAEFQALGEQEEPARRKTERMLVFQERAAPTLEAKLKSAVGSEISDPLFSRLTLNIENDSYLVSIERPAERTGLAPDTAWGIIIDADRVRENVLRPALDVHFPAEEKSWTVKGRDGTIIQSSVTPASGPVTLRKDFASNFPDWSLEFHQPPPRFVKTFLLTRRGLYFFVFLLIAGILVFGLALTVRSVSHELALARMKSDFVSTVSHEFKSPLTSIRQLAEMLQSGRVPSEERRQKYYDVLLEQIERLTLLTDNILGLAKIEEGRAEFAFEITDISSLLTEIMTTIQDRVRHEGFEIGLVIEGPLPPLPTDRTALSQAVTNLVDNAVKYSGDSRKISVRAALEGAHITIAVRDFGVGIKKEDIPRLFERFYRAGDELTRTVKGSGLGLTLVKEIVEAHRGRIEVESEQGRGSTFTIRLPLGRQERG